jgi:hypothetical protein
MTIISIANTGARPFSLLETLEEDHYLYCKHWSMTIISIVNTGIRP